MPPSLSGENVDKVLDFSAAASLLRSYIETFFQSQNVDKSHWFFGRRVSITAVIEPLPRSDPPHYPWIVTPHYPRIVTPHYPGENVDKNLDFSSAASLLVVHPTFLNFQDSDPPHYPRIVTPLLS